MDEYASLRKIEFELCGGNLPEKYKAFVRRVLNDRNIIPAADVAPVVRCRDCAHLYGSMCAACGLLLRRPDEFCSRGERKDGADSDIDGSV